MSNLHVDRTGFPGGRKKGTGELEGVLGGTAFLGTRKSPRGTYKGSGQKTGGRVCRK